ncbi:hypothetical protein DLAC_01759 [Tieghemostelium lacteum]|uniref:SPIN90/Ldb17 leucine-rich domain-containing protein n=1 Tax=Tieghemostelium lacteum TaxID=361077 RepID=A0A152A6J6_TIELA|nr:hypothetical protein DLAC_01759 [Tieghemostelium lacteum]|eukprot:KYR01751.1 hypothetical protein DLAC_01759 [Tieghemostelium lacteum]
MESKEIEERNDEDWVICYDDEKAKKCIQQYIDSKKINKEQSREIITYLQNLEYNDIETYISADNFYLIEAFCQLIENSTDTQYVLELIEFINAVSKIEGTMDKMVQMESFKWLIPNLFMFEEEKQYNILNTLTLIFTNVRIIPESEMKKFDDSFLEGFIDIGLNFLNYYDTKWLHYFYYTVLGYQKHIISTTYSPLVYKLYSIKKAPELGPELISLLNREKFDYPLEDQCLSLINDLFSYSVEFQVPVFFFTLDIKVLIDIILRAIHNLEELDPLRWQYLEVLFTILQHPEYTELQHKIDDIKQVLTDLTLPRSEEKDPSSSMIAKRIISYLNTSF